MARLLLTDLTIQRLKPPETGQLAFWDTSLRGFGVRVSQGGSKTFVVNHSGRLHTIGRYPTVTLKQARQDAKKLQTTKVPSLTSKPLLEASSAFLAACEKNTKTATVKQYKMYLDRFPSKPLSSITRADITEHLKQYDDKPTSQNYAYATFRALFNWCVEQEYLTHSPITRMRAPNRLKSRERVLSDNEITKLWEATDYPYGHYVRCLLLTGARKMELYNHRVENDHLYFPDTKNGKPHVLPLTPLVKQHLAKWNINHWSTKKNKLDKMSGVTEWRIHDLRRTWATIAIRLGVPSDHVEAVLNHTAKGVRGIYQRWHLLPEKKAALLTVEAFIATLTKPGHQPGPCTAPIGVEHENPE